jgi:nitrate reductase gamma subunit
VDGLTIFYTVFSYLAATIFILGFLTKVITFAKTPAPLKIPQTPAPTTRLGVFFRMLLEVVFFRSLFKGNKLLWLGGYLFHGTLLVVLLRHLRFFIHSVPGPLMSFQVVELYFGYILLCAIVFLFLRRVFVDRTVFFSILSDYFILALLFSIALTGVLQKYFFRSDIIHVKRFVLGLLTFRPEAFPQDVMFILHFSLVLILLVYFSFSKLMHAGGIFFSPTRTQRDDAK